MKRCPKCSRLYPDDNQKFCTVDGGLLGAVDQSFDPNATIQSDASALNQSVPPTVGLTDLNKTIASSGSGPTEVLGSPKTEPVPGNATIIDRAIPAPPPAQPPRAPAPPPPAAPSRAAAPVAPAAAAPRKKSKLPLILGVLALLLVLGVGAVVAAFFLVIKPRMDQTNRETVATTVNNENSNTSTSEATNTPAAETKTVEEFVPPPGTVKFANSKTNLDGKLAEHYFDFSFYYPNGWQVDPEAGVPGASNFAKVERRLPPDFTQENFAVGWYTSQGTFEADKNTFPQLVELLGANLAKGFPGYQKVSEGPTKINSLDGYEFRFTSVSKGTEKGDINLWGRVVFLPPGVEGNQNGATIIMLATSLAPELSGVSDVGEKGEMPVILESFRFDNR